MTRQEFLRISTAFGIGTTLLPSVLTSCSEQVDLFGGMDVNFSGKVLIVGAGASGMMAGYFLSQQNIDFEIVEASSVCGGRVKETESFADFPIDLGAEWIHEDPSILAKLINDDSVKASIDIIEYAPETLYIWTNGKLKKRNFFTHFYGEYKFKNTTWYDFFDAYIIPKIENNIIYNNPIELINYENDIVEATAKDGTVYTSDRLILTVPLTILKNNMINFQPPLPQSKINALNAVDMPDGIKVFMEFSERFYPDLTFSEGLLDILSDSDGEKIYYDAAFRKDTDRNILGLFTVGEPATQYATIDTDEELIQYILNELDTMFEGKASQYYMKHVTQNWSKEPYILGSYSHFDDYGLKPDLVEPLEGKVFFAGEAFGRDDNHATVHYAGESAYNAVREILANQ